MKRITKLFICLYLFAFVFLCGCGGKDIQDAEIVSKQLMFTGKTMKPDIRVFYDDIELTEGKDYELSGAVSVLDIGEYSVTVKGIGSFSGSRKIDFVVYAPDSSDVSSNSMVNDTRPVDEKSIDEQEIVTTYRANIVGEGWQVCVQNGDVAGEAGAKKVINAIDISIKSDYVLNIKYTTYCQGSGWQPWSTNGEISGFGDNKRVEAMAIVLDGPMAEYYDVYYRVHSANYGWLEWAKNGEPTGTTGMEKAIEAYQVVVLKKGKILNKKFGQIKSNQEGIYYQAEENTAENETLQKTFNDINICYRAQLQKKGWQTNKYNGMVAGTDDDLLRLEAFTISILNNNLDGEIQYNAYVEDEGWNKDWIKQGEIAGTVGEKKKIEVIQIQLTDELAKQYDIYYRVKCEQGGWLNWAKNGEKAGVNEKDIMLMAMQIVLVKKGEAAPDANYGGITSQNEAAYIK